MKAPFPWFGGKSRVAHLVWERFGDVPNYVEPFAGSLAVLLGRETAPRVETVNDIDTWIANFWRSLQSDPEGVAAAADWPVNEADLHARHLWLVNQIDFKERMKTDPDFYDVKIAGWWCWGICQWIGSGWCAEPQWRRTNAGRAARGVNSVPRNSKRHPAKAEDGSNAVWAVRPFLGGDGQGNGINRKMPYAGRDERGLLSRTAAKRSRLGRGAGRAVSRQLPDVSGDGGASGRGIHSLAMARTSNTGLIDWMITLADRLRRVRVCCGDWQRILGPSVTHKIGLTGIFLDPPYDMRVVSNTIETGRDGAAPPDKLYENHDNDLSAAVCRWAIEHGNNPLLRIAVCGYEGEHSFPETWEKVAWKASGGFGNQNQNTNGAINATRERIWFSPHCLNPSNRLFD